MSTSEDTPDPETTQQAAYEFAVVPLVSHLEWDSESGSERFTDGDFRVWPYWIAMRSKGTSFPRIADLAEAAGTSLNAFYQFFYRAERAGLAKIHYGGANHIIDVEPTYSTDHQERKSATAAELAQARQDDQLAAELAAATTIAAALAALDRASALRVLAFVGGHYQATA